MYRVMINEKYYISGFGGEETTPGEPIVESYATTLDKTQALNFASEEQAKSIAKQINGKVIEED